ncbi:MAG: tetratricopeptide repeat protein [Desulfatitalea sp.]
MSQELPLLLPVTEIEFDVIRGHDLDYLCQLAENYYKTGALDIVERLCARILNQAPNCAAAHNLRALMRFKKGDYPAALDIVETILSREPENYRAVLTRGQCYLAQNHFEKALSDFNKAIQINPDQPDAHIGLGIAYSLAGQTDLVSDCFVRAVQVAPRRETAYAVLGLHQFIQGDLQGSVKAYLQAIEINDTIIENYTGLKRSVDALLQRIGLDDSTTNCPSEQVPAFHCEHRTYAFAKILNYNELVGENNVAHFSTDDCKPSTFASLANYYADISLQVPILWNHKDVRIEYHRGQLYVQNQKGEIIPTILSQLESRAISAKCPYYHEKQDVVLVGCAPCQKEICDGPYVVMNFAGYFGHFMFDELPYLAYMRSMLKERKMKILVPKMNAIAAKFLGFLEFPKECLVTWEELCGIGAQKPVSLQVEDAWFPIRLPLALSVEIVRQAFHRQMPIPSQLGRRKLYISRGGQRLINERAIECALAREGFEIVRPEFMPVAEQMRLFGDACIIVCCIGSGVASMMWSPIGTAIIEIIGDALPNYSVIGQRGQDLLKHLEILCRSHGHHAFRVMGKCLHELGPSKLLDHVTCKINGKWRDVHFSNVEFMCDPAQVLAAVEIATKAQQFS